MTRSAESPRDNAAQVAPSHPEDKALVAVRRRATFLIGALLWAAAGGSILLALGSVSVALNVVLSTSEQLRRVLGLEPPITGPDWYLLAVFTLIVSVPIIAMGALWRWYARIWRRRLNDVWQDSPDRRTYSRLRPVPLTANAKEKQERAAYLAALLASPGWQVWWSTSQRNQLDHLLIRQGGVSESVSDAQYRQTAEQVLRRIEDDIAERAIAVGLIVGLGPSRGLDRLTIISAALEIQLYVLSRLGKRPSFSTWMELLKRTGASLLINAYLNREDYLVLSLAIKKIAMGLEAAAELGEEASEYLGDLDVSEAVDEALESSGGVVRLAGTIMSFGVSTVAPASLAVGATAARQVAQVIDEVGNQLLQGVLAGAVLYYHGMAIAAETLALDSEHRNSPGMYRTPWQGATKTAVVAGQLLRGHVKQYRAAHRERRTRALRLATRYLPRRKMPGQEERPVVTGPLPAPPSLSKRRRSFKSPWNGRRRAKVDEQGA
jgi:hypothetical protein